MGVADNKTYRDQYHFKDDYKVTGDEYPSINDEDRINQTIKENPYRSNVSIEGGEVVLQPDLTALFKATGKKHSGGGMDVFLKPDSFIFSDFKGLALTERDHKQFELKEGGNFNPVKNTPAEVLKRNIPIKHYNTQVNNLQDPHKDDLTKKTASLMLEKYIKTLGNIAFIQEQKKLFPDGMPEFSQGTAPVYDSSLKDNVMESKQYAKYGGTINNPYVLPKAQWGGFGLHRQVAPPPRQITGSGVPRQDRYIGQRPPYPDVWTNYYDKQQKKQYTAPDWIDPKTFYATPGLVDYMKTLDRTKGVDWDMSKADDAWWGWRHEAARQRFFPQENTPQIPPHELPPHAVQPPNTPAPITKDDIPHPNIINGDGQGEKRADWEFTPWQKISQMYNWGQYANVKRYMPYRSRYNATYTEPSLLNPEQAVGDAKAMANQQLQSLGSMSPILRNAQASQSYGQALNQIPGIRAQYDNQNAQINNQSRQYNNQVRNNESMVNMQNDQNYYQQAVTARANFDNMRTYTANNAMNNTLRDVESNQKLAYTLLGQNNPAYGFDWRTGNFTRNDKQIMDVQGNAASDAYGQLFEEINRANDPVALQKLALKEKLLRQKNILPYLQQQQPPVFKKGGKTKKNPYKWS